MSHHGISTSETITFTLSTKIKLSLNFVNSTSITQKAHGTYIHVLEGADVGVLWSNVTEGTGEPGENHQTWTGDHYPATWLDPDSNPDRSGDKRVCYPLRYPGLQKLSLMYIVLQSSVCFLFPFLAK